jgi:hypothetical protein
MLHVSGQSSGQTFLTIVDVDILGASPFKV